MEILEGIVMLESMVDEYYDDKSPEYFSGVRWDLVRAIAEDPKSRILEIGCGTGDTGAAALREGRCGQYCGIELNESAAEQARQQISEVIVGNVESIPLPWGKNSFDVLIISEVLEHLIDPWKVLRRLHPLMKPGAVVFASSPNISHYRVIKMLLAGQWKLEDAGVMDRTHLRWFTPTSYSQMFESCGYRVESITSVTPMSWKTKLINIITFNRMSHVFFVQINLCARVEEKGSTDAS